MISANISVDTLSQQEVRFSPTGGTISVNRGSAFHQQEGRSVSRGRIIRTGSVISPRHFFIFEKRAPLFKFTSQTARTWARKQFIYVIGMYLTKMAACKKANGSFLQLQGLEGSDLPSAKLLAAVTEQGFARFAIATYNDIHD